ncbi:MAG TPA: glycosyl hydrolase [Verrucomicrobiae bacterium]|nr:glycosyl hydrolase [Verrucomicrobiae bacterium]
MPCTRPRAPYPVACALLTKGAFKKSTDAAHSKRFGTFGCGFAVLLCLLSLLPIAQGRPSLESGFMHPPASARPWVYWFWLNGNITSNGVTADLEAMQRVGIGGVLIMEVDQGAPKGPTDFGGPKWRGLFQHVCGEAHRLGLEVNMNNDAGWCGSGGPWITPELAMQKVVWSETNVTGPCRFEGELPQPKAVAHYYRDIAMLAFPTPAGHARISDIDGKAAFVPKHIPVTGDFKAVPADQSVAEDAVTNLSSCLGTNGQVVWDVPAGEWTILRFGHTTTGADNHPAPEPGRGLESDKLSRAATDAMFAGLMGKLIADSKPLAGKTIVSTHIDSWETGSQNWTPLFRKKFQKRRGYDPLRFLPVLTGRVMGSVEMSERFLWDLRQTVSDLLVENYAGRFRQLAHQHGLRLSIEAYDGDPADDMTYAGQADEPMAEFWSWGNDTSYSCLEMSSAAHVYGRRILGAEAFTANDQEKWLHHPATIKTLGDWAFCEGINRFVFHRYALQPWRDRRPGMSMGPWGLHYERTQTWWDESASWHEYLARCQYLLRQGLFVADACFLEPEGSPRRFIPTMPWRSGNMPDRPRYNFDGCSPEVVLTRMKVKDGRLVLPDGMSYRVLVLPQVDTMTPKLLRKIKALVQAGATVIGPPPTKSPSLADYPKCDAEIKAIAGELWSTETQSAFETVSSHTQHASRGHRQVLWADDFRTQPPFETLSPLHSAKWIWHNEGNPATAAPVGPRYFRRVLDLSERPQIRSANLAITCDNSFEVWVNGNYAGTGADFTRGFTFEIANWLKEGTNLIAVAGINGGENPNPAGLIAVLRIGFADGSNLEVDTDKMWESSPHQPENWLADTSPHETWSPALELGPFGMSPWKDSEKSAVPPYVFPDFQAIAGLLRSMGVAPDFEGDSRLRYIHRRDGNTDFYFVANSQTNWLQANCGFRVTGKVPEIWDPMTGEITRAAIFEERGAQTFVQLPFEPAGSMFMVFRERRRGVAQSQRQEVLAEDHSPAPLRAPLIGISRGGQDLLPGPGQAIASAPSLELSADKKSQAQAVIWQPGAYEFTAASGQRRSIEVSALPPAVEASGPWEVHFEPGWGAPDHLTFDHLLDWSQSAHPGVKYFSGSALYETTFDAPADLCGPAARAYLDLGNVAVMARVRLNGKDLGTLWKAPFRVDVTDALKPGKNVLEVKVVNLWVNRMIGDEQLPEDSDRNSNGTLKEWPAWLSADQPSPTGRYTFTSWPLWKKDSPLQPSGLLGPVRILSAKAVSLVGD